MIPPLYANICLHHLILEQGKNCKATAVERLRDARTQISPKQKQNRSPQEKKRCSFANCRCFAGSKKGDNTNYVKGLEAAESCYSQIVNIDPGHVQGKHNFCVFMIEQGQYFRLLSA